MMNVRRLELSFSTHHSALIIPHSFAPSLTVGLPPCTSSLTLAVLLKVFDPQLRVGVLPRGLELAARRGGLPRLVLRFEALPESEERAPAARVAPQVFAEDRLGLGCTAFGEQHAAERLARGQEPPGRLVVSPVVLH